jgi:hypothetical protein
VLQHIISGERAVPSENYGLNPALRLEEVLKACLWKQIDAGLWQMDRSRLLVDHIGIFYYQLLGGLWVRVSGISYNYIKILHLRERNILFENFILDLLAGIPTPRRLAAP